MFNKRKQQWLARERELLKNNVLASKYNNMNQAFCELKTVQDLIYNEQSKPVSIFKDYLILDDVNEFLRRQYTFKEAKHRIPKLA